MLTNDGDPSPHHSSLSSVSSSTSTILNGPTSAQITTNSSSSQSAVIRNNVSVTNIKCEDNIPTNSPTCNTISLTPSILNGLSNSTTITPLPSGNNSYFNGIMQNITPIRIAVPKVEDSEDESESELSNIESLKVSRRSNTNKNGPRPMSWEGGLSEAENELMETDQSNHIQKHYDETQIMSIKEESRHFDESKTDYDNIINSATNLTTTGNTIITATKKFQHNEILNLKYEPGSSVLDSSSTSCPSGSGLNSPLLARSKVQTQLLPANPSPDSAIHSVYTHSSPSQSPLTSRHAPYTPSLSRNNSDASHSSCYSYSSEFSPTHSPIQGRHNIYGGNGTASINTSGSVINQNGQSFIHSVLYRPIHDNLDNNQLMGRRQEPIGQSSTSNTTDVLLDSESGIPSPGISRQQLINSPCPICSDKISGFHYGIFSCESCKGFFKRTVQNRKNYVCVRGGPCPVTISTRKKCPACRFDKCLNKGMKLEAIREDRTRGGRSTYQCSYTLPNPLIMSEAAAATAANLIQANVRMNGCVIKSEDGCNNQRINPIPILLQEIMDVEHLWQYNDSELSRINQPQPSSSTSCSGISTADLTTNPLLASAGLSSNGENTNPDLIATLCNVADLRLLKIVKWCKSLPLFKNISIDDQICLLINSWCELLLFSCCFRSLTSPGEIRISLGKTITLAQAKNNGLTACVERMLNLTEHLRRLRVDRYEYVAMKVIVLLQSDTTELREPVKVRENQEKALQALQSYTLAHYPETPSKFGELLLRIPELQRTCQLVKEMLLIKSKDGEDFNLLMELLRGEH